jgi:hypothetical protein
MHMIRWPFHGRYLVMAVSNTAKTRIIDARLRRYRKIPGGQTHP